MKSQTVNYVSIGAAHRKSLRLSRLDRSVISASLLLLLLVPPLVAADKDAVVRIGGCTGVCVHPDGLVLTAKHCTLPKRIDVRFSGGKTSSAQLIYTSPDAEGPVVYDCDGDGYPWAPVAAAVPPAGSNVYSWGYPFRGERRRLERAAGTLTSSVKMDQGGKEWMANIASFPVASGWSGGPLFWEGKVVGLCSNTGSDSSGWVSWAATRKAYEATVAKRKVYVFTSRGCPPCEQFKADLKAGRLGDGYEWVLVEHGSAQWRTMDARVRKATGKGVTVTPTFYVARSTQIVTGYVGATGLLKIVGGIVIELVKFIVGEVRERRSEPPRPVPPTRPVPPLELEAPPVPIEESTPLPPDVRDLAEQFRSGIARVRKLEDAGLVEKVKTLRGLKSDVEDVKTGVELNANAVIAAREYASEQAKLMRETVGELKDADSKLEKAAAVARMAKQAVDVVKSPDLRYLLALVTGIAGLLGVAPHIRAPRIIVAAANVAATVDDAAQKVREAVGKSNGRDSKASE